jgi:hypothetical protein
MSTGTNVLATANQSITNYDSSKIFLWGNEFINATVEAGQYDDVLPGTLMGRIAATQVVVPLESDATDGSQFPLGILNGTVEAGDSKVASICVNGDVDEDSVLLTKVGDTLNTIVSDRILRDRILGDTKGINLISAVQLSKLDNQ